MLRDIADFEMELEEGIMTEFDQNALSKNYGIFYNTVYVTSDLASDNSHVDSEAEFHHSNSRNHKIRSNKPLTPKHKKVTDRIHTPLRLSTTLSTNSSDVYFYDDV